MIWREHSSSWKSLVSCLFLGVSFAPRLLFGSSISDFVLPLKTLECLKDSSTVLLPLVKLLRLVRSSDLRHARLMTHYWNITSSPFIIHQNGMGSLTHWGWNMEQHVFLQLIGLLADPILPPCDTFCAVRWAWNLHACVLGVTFKSLWVCDVKTFNDFVFAIRFPFCPAFCFPGNDLHVFLSYVVKWIFIWIKEDDS